MGSLLARMGLSSHCNMLQASVSLLPAKTLWESSELSLKMNLKLVSIYLGKKELQTHKMLRDGQGPNGCNGDRAPLQHEEQPWSPCSVITSCPCSPQRVLPAGVTAPWP